MFEDGLGTHFTFYIGKNQTPLFYYTFKHNFLRNIPLFHRAFSALEFVRNKFWIQDVSKWSRIHSIFTELETDELAPFCDTFKYHGFKDISRVFLILGF